MNILRWLRVVGDTFFAIGIIVLAHFVVGFKTGWSLTGEIDVSDKKYPQVETEEGISKIEERNN